MLIDSHVHLFIYEKEDNLASVIDDAQRVGVTAFISAPVDLDSSYATLRLAQKWSEIYPTIGIHPWWSREASFDQYEAIAELAKNDKVVAIGEIGIDTVRCNVPLYQQEVTLEAMLNIAENAKLPIVLHGDQLNEANYKRLLEIVRRAKLSAAGFVHGFCGSKNIVMQWLNIGFSISVSAAAFSNARGSSEALVKVIPKDRLLIETDAPAPYAPPARQGSDNRPAYLPYVAELVGSEIGLSARDVAILTANNARRVLRLSIEQN